MMSVSAIGFEHLVHFACMRHLAPLWGVSRPLVSPDHRRNRLRPDVIAIDGRAGATISLSCGLTRGVQAKDKVIDFRCWSPRLPWLAPEPSVSPPRRFLFELGTHAH